jgi:formiminotetrahydrofolate cyclodeaminase
MAVEVMDLARQAVAAGNVNAISDGATATALARAGLAGAGYNVRANAAALGDPAPAGPALERLAALEARAAGLEDGLRQHLASRGGSLLP